MKKLITLLLIVASTSCFALSDDDLLNLNYYTRVKVLYGKCVEHAGTPKEIPFKCQLEAECALEIEFMDDDCDFDVYSCPKCQELYLRCYDEERNFFNRVIEFCKE